jgi:hypothetical protein
MYNESTNPWTVINTSACWFSLSIPCETAT